MQEQSVNLSLNQTKVTDWLNRQAAFPIQSGSGEKAQCSKGVLNIRFNALSLFTIRS